MLQRTQLNERCLVSNSRIIRFIQIGLTFKLGEIKLFAF